MALDITIEQLTDGEVVNKEWEGTGVFDILMEKVNKNINLQYAEKRINGSDYAKVYLGALQTTISQSIEFLFREKLTEIQYDNLVKDGELKDKDLLIRDKTLEKMDEEIDLLQTEDLTKLYNKDNILPAQLADIIKTTDVKERGMVEQEATGVKQRELLDTEEEAKQYEVDNLQPKQLEQLEEQIDLLQSQDLDVLEGTLSKKASRLNQTAQIRAELDKQWGYDTTLGLDDTIVLGTANTDGLVDKQVLDTVKKTELIVEQIESEELKNKTDGLIEYQTKKVKRELI